MARSDGTASGGDPVKLPRIETRCLHKSYQHDIRALDDVSLIVPDGSFALILGASGSGKTTLLSIMSLIDRPTDGSLLYAGEDVTKLSDAGRSRLRRRIGIVTQDFALISGLSVWENVTYPQIPGGMARSERKRHAEVALERVGLTHRMNARAQELSGGERQRTAIARALVGKPEVFILDEPTSNLDDVTGQRVTEAIREEYSRGATIVVASHDSRFEKLATEAIELVNGRRRIAA